MGRASCPVARPDNRGNRAAARRGALLEKPQRKPRHARHEHRAQQALVVAGHPPVVLGETCSISSRGLSASPISAVPVAGKFASRATPSESMPRAMPMRSRIKCTHGRDPREEPRPAPPRERAPVPRVPVHEEQDVAAFFLDHRLEGFNEFGREIAGALRGTEQAEREETVDAFAEARDDPPPLGIFRCRVGRLGASRMPYASTSFDSTTLCRASSPPSISSARRNSGLPIVAA